MNGNDFSSFVFHNAKEQGKKIKMINNKVKECRMKLRLMSPRPLTSQRNERKREKERKGKLAAFGTSTTLNVKIIDTI